MIRGSAGDCQRGGGGEAQLRPRVPVRLAVVLALLLLAATAAVVLSGAWRWISLDQLRDRREALQTFVREHPVLSLEIYMGAYAAVVALSLPGALIMSLAGGYLFGAWRGTAAAVAGMTVGAVVMYLLSRFALGGWLERSGRLRSGWVGKLEAGLRDNAVSALLTLRLIPGLPFCLVNLAAGALRAPLGVYVLTTAAGIAPSTLIYCWVGQGLGHAFKRSGAIDPGQLVTPAVYGPLAGLFVLAATPLLLKWLRRRRDGDAAGAPAPARPR